MVVPIGVTMETELRKIGLSKSEIKVYLALLRNGVLTKTPIVRNAKIPASKVYEVLDKLIDKGLVSVVTKNNVKHFEAASPVKIKEFLQKKKREILDAENNLDLVLPDLLNARKIKESKPHIEVYYGWKGLSTVYEEEVEKINKNSKVYIIGASTGENQERTELFFSKYGKKVLDKNADIKVIFNTTAREYIKRIEKNIGKEYKKRFLFRKTPTEITIRDDTTLILILKAEPIVIKIINQETADSFKQYFDVLWKQAKA